MWHQAVPIPEVPGLPGGCVTMQVISAAEGPTKPLQVRLPELPARPVQDQDPDQGLWGHVWSGPGLP